MSWLTRCCGVGLLLFLGGCSGGAVSSDLATSPVGVDGSTSDGTELLETTGPADVATVADTTAAMPEAGADQTTDDQPETPAAPPFVPPAGLTLLAGKMGGPGHLDGLGKEARLTSPNVMILGPGGQAYFVDNLVTVRKVDLATGLVSTLAGQARSSGYKDGVGAAARFNSAYGLTLTPDGDLYVVESSVIRKISTASGEVTTVAGAPDDRRSVDGEGKDARFRYASAVAADAQGNLFVADGQGQLIRKMVLATGVVTTVSGATLEIPERVDAVGTAARFSDIDSLASDGAGNLFIADGNVLRRMVIATGQVTTLPVEARIPGLSAPLTLWYEGEGRLIIADANHSAILRLWLDDYRLATLAGIFGSVGDTDTATEEVRFDFPRGAVVHDGNLYVSELGRQAIRRVNLTTGEISTLAGGPSVSGSKDGIGSAARFFQPKGLAGDGGDNLFVADSKNSTIRRISLRTGSATTAAGTARLQGGTGGAGPAARFNTPIGLAFDKPNRLFITDSDSGKGSLFQLQTDSGLVTVVHQVATVAAAGRFWNPSALATDGLGQLYIGDTFWSGLVQFDLASETFRTLAPKADENGRLNVLELNPGGGALDGRGNAYVAGIVLHAIYKVVIATTEVTVLAGLPRSSGFFDGVGQIARFNEPHELAFDGDDHLLVADSENGAIRRVSVTTSEVSTWIGGPGRRGVRVGALPASLNQPRGIIALPGGGAAIVDAVENVVLLAH